MIWSKCHWVVTNIDRFFLFKKICDTSFDTSKNLIGSLGAGLNMVLNFFNLVIFVLAYSFKFKNLRVWKSDPISSINNKLLIEVGDCLRIEIYNKFKSSILLVWSFTTNSNSILYKCEIQQLIETNHLVTKFSLIVDSSKTKSTCFLKKSESMFRNYLSWLWFWF